MGVDFYAVHGVKQQELPASTTSNVPPGRGSETAFHESSPLPPKPTFGYFGGKCLPLGEVYRESFSVSS